MIFRGLALRGYGQEKHGNIFDLDEKGEAMMDQSVLDSAVRIATNRALAGY